MRLSFWTVAVGLACVLGGADRAFAWGPAAHVGLAASVLEHLSLLPTAVAAVLGRHAVAYLYGCIAADVVFAKRLSRVKQFCHHWSTGFGLLDCAGDDRAKAFAYGYLSHLAADTVAHGKYVPRQIVISECTVSFGHLYWELRADAREDEPTWRLLQRVLLRDHSDHHRMLSDHIKDTFLTYDFNRVLFDGISTLTAAAGFRRAVTAIDRYSRWYLAPELMDGYRAECLDRIHAILAEGHQSALVREDPNGVSTLMHLRVHRRDIRRRRRRGLPLSPRLLEASTALAPQPHGGLSDDCRLRIEDCRLSIGDCGFRNSFLEVYCGLRRAGSKEAVHIRVGLDGAPRQGGRPGLRRLVGQPPRARPTCPNRH